MSESEKIWGDWVDATGQETSTAHESWTFLPRSDRTDEEISQQIEILQKRQQKQTRLSQPERSPDDAAKDEAKRQRVAIEAIRGEAMSEEEFQKLLRHQLMMQDGRWMQQIRNQNAKEKRTEVPLAAWERTVALYFRSREQLIAELNKERARSQKLAQESELQPQKPIKDLKGKGKAVATDEDGPSLDLLKRALHRLEHERDELRRQLQAHQSALRQYDDRGTRVSSNWGESIDQHRLAHYQKHYKPKDEELFRLVRKALGLDKESNARLELSPEERAFVDTWKTRQLHLVGAAGECFGMQTKVKRAEGIIRLRNLRLLIITQAEVLRAEHGDRAAGGEENDDDDDILTPGLYNRATLLLAALLREGGDAEEAEEAAELLAIIPREAFASEVTWVRGFADMLYSEIKLPQERPAIVTGMQSARQGSPALATGSGGMASQSLAQELGNAFDEEAT